MDTSSLATSEQAKYETMWQHDDYRTFSPGLFALERLDLAGSFRQHGVRSILDAGCGSGKFMRSILENHATVFNSTVHPAGALGVPTLVLLTRDNDWRWGVDGVPCPWYQSVMRVWQQAEGNWSVPQNAAERFVEQILAP
jgi:hypothetical protein